MRTSALVCATLASTLGFGSVAQAQDWHRGHRDGREARQEHRQERQQWRAERREARQEARQQQRWAQQQQRNWAYNRPAYVVQQPSYVYSQPYAHSYQPGYVSGVQYYQGGYLPHAYRQPRYYVNDWHAYPGLYAPPSGYQWVNTGTDFALIALTTGLIATLLSR